MTRAVIGGEGMLALVIPVFAGVAVGELRAVDSLLFEKTRGFSAVFTVAAFMHLGVPFLRRKGIARSKPNDETAI